MKNKLSILVIDDEISLGPVYTTFLSKIDADVTYFDHPQKGWRAIETEKYDLIITDLRMPVITGDEFISIVRGSKLNSKTPIILSSGYINKLVLTEMSRESKIYFLTKPFDSKSLIDLVTKALSAKKSEEDSSEHTLQETWIPAFQSKLKEITGEETRVETIKNFELWNFEAIHLSFVVTNGNEQLSVTMVMKMKMFFKMAGIIQGTQYQEIEEEILQMWQELLANTCRGTSRVTFAKVISAQIITLPDQKASFHKFSNSSGEVLAYLS